MSLTTVNKSTFWSVVREKEVAMVDFSTQWCPPCKLLPPILEELQNDHVGQLAILHIECDESPELVAEFGIMSTPTVIMFHKGEPVDKIVGLRSKAVYQAAIRRYL